MFLSLLANAQAPQGVSIKNTTSPPHASAMLDVESTNKGLLMPRMALSNYTQQIGAVANADGLMVFNTSSVTSTGSGTAAVSNGLQGRGMYYWDAMATPAQWVKQGSAPNNGSMNIPKMTFSQMGASTFGKTDADVGSLVFVTTTTSISFYSNAQVGASAFSSAPNYTFIPMGSAGIGNYRTYNVYGLWYLAKTQECGYWNTYVWRYIGNFNLGNDLNLTPTPPANWNPTQGTCYLYPPKPNMEAGEDHHLGMVVNVPDEEKPLIGPMEEDKVQGINSRK